MGIGLVSLFARLLKKIDVIGKGGSRSKKNNKNVETGGGGDKVRSIDQKLRFHEEVIQQPVYKHSKNDQT